MRATTRTQILTQTDAPTARSSWLRRGPPPRPARFGVCSSGFAIRPHSCVSLLRIRIRIRARANHDLMMRCDAPGSGARAALVGWVSLAVGPRI